MGLTQRNKHTPSGLTRFLAEHEECPKGLETLRDSSLVTVICHGCEASFSYLTEVHATEPTEVERALNELASGAPEQSGSGAPKADSPPQPAESGVSAAETAAPASNRALAAPRVQPNSNGADVLRDEGAEWRRERGLRMPVRSRSGTGPRPTADGAGSIRSVPPPVPGSSGRPRRLPPPGPHSNERIRVPKRKRVEELTTRLNRLFAAVARRRRPIAMAAMSLAGAYVVVVLSAGGEQGASDTGSPLGSADLPLQAAPPGEAEDPVAGDARTLESLEGGGPDAEPIDGGDGSFEVTLPPDWQRGTTDQGSDVYRSASGAATVLIKVEKDAGAGLGTLADRAAAFLAIKLSPGAEVKRIPAREEGELLAVARADGDPVQTAYVAAADELQYLVATSHEDDAPALERLQAEGIVRSFESAGDGKSAE